MQTAAIYSGAPSGDAIPTHSYNDPGSFNLRDLDTGLIVGKRHIEPSADNMAGGRSYIVHTGIAKSSTGDSGWGVYAKPTQLVAKQMKYEGTGESLSTFLSWLHDSGRKSNLMYTVSIVREQDVVP